jgi:hypothetical protein
MIIGVAIGLIAILAMRETSPNHADRASAKARRLDVFKAANCFGRGERSNAKERRKNCPAS